MKRKILLLSVSAVLFSLSACDSDDKMTNKDGEIELPSTTRTFLDVCFPGQAIVNTHKDNDEYKVYFKNYKIEFDRNGVWKQVDGKQKQGDYKAIPQFFLNEEMPEEIAMWIMLNYPNTFVVEIEKERENGIYTGYDIELSNGTDDLHFDLNGNYTNGSNPFGPVTLPEKANTFLTAYFANDAIVSQRRDDNGGYEVILKSGIEIDFDGQGVWDNVDGKFENRQYKALPEAFLTAELPAVLMTFVKTNYPSDEIIEVDKEHERNIMTGYEVDLSGGAELDFDTQGNLRGNGGISSIELPQAAKDFMNIHFNGLAYTVIKDKDDFDVYAGAYKIEFDLQGNWDQVDGKIMKGNYKAVPESFLRIEPLNLIADYVLKQYPGAQILEVEKEYNNNRHTGYEFTLDNNVELDFGLTGPPSPVIPGGGGSQNPGNDPTVVPGGNNPPVSGGGNPATGNNNLPQTVQAFINAHFRNVEIRYTKQERDEYEVYLNGYDLEFDLQGNWKKVSSVGYAKVALPESLLFLSPVNNINNYIRTNYPGRYIIEIEKDYDNRKLNYDIELDNRKELVFNADGQFVRVDY